MIAIVLTKINGFLSGAHSLNRCARVAMSSIYYCEY